MYALFSQINHYCILVFYVEILVSMLNRPAKFKLIKLRHTEIAQSTVTYVADSTLKVNDLKNAKRYSITN